MPAQETGFFIDGNPLHLFIRVCPHGFNMKAIQKSLPLSIGSDTDRDAQRWSAVVSRCATASDCFVYGVKTTGVYCRPDTPTKRPKRENVVFFDNEDAARAAGYRPSRHLAAAANNVSKQRTALVAQACAAIEAAEAAPGLTQLAARLNVSPAHFHRIFKAETGLTPKAYAAAVRAKRIRENLSGAPDGQPASRSSTRISPSITQAVFDAGFNANSRFYESATHRLGMTPRNFKNGGHQAQIRFALGQSTLGAILVASSQHGICAILMGDDPETLLQSLQDRFPNATLIGADEAYEQYVAQVVGLVEAPALGVNLPLDIRGTAFQERVWRALQAIPPGTTATYSDVAQAIGAPGAVRAVARACGANHIAIAIPCHRVVRKDGDVSGYRWGVERKIALLQREKRDPSP